MKTNRGRRLATVVVLLLMGLPMKSRQTCGVEASQVQGSSVGGPIVEGLQLWARAETPTVAASDPVVLQVGLRNTTAQLYRVVPGALLNQSALEVKNEKGASARLTAYGGNPLNKLITGSFAAIPLQPNEELRLKLLVSRAYDMTEIGDYTITVKHTVHKQGVQGHGPDAFAMLVSNPVKIHVINPRFPLSEGVSSAIPAITTPTHAGIPVIVRTSPTAFWQVGDLWHLAVEFYTVVNTPVGIDKAHQDNNVLVGRYVMQVKVVGSEIVEGQDCWMVDFTPAQDAPSTVSRESYRVWVGKQDGLARRLVSLKGRFNPPLEKIKGIPLPGGTVLGFPLEFLPVYVQKLEDKAEDGYAFTLTTEATTTTLVTQANLRIANKDRLMLKQTWATGAKWWSEYEKQDYNQHLILKARLLAE